MVELTYNIQIVSTGESGPLLDTFNGYFTVNTDNKLVTGFYANANPGVNILSSTTQYGADKTYSPGWYSFDGQGLSLISFPGLQGEVNLYGINAQIGTQGILGEVGVGGIIDAAGNTYPANFIITASLNNPNFFFSIALSYEPNGSPFYNGYFVTDSLTNQVTQFYDLTFPYNAGINLILVGGSFGGDNLYNPDWKAFDGAGINIKSFPPLFDVDGNYNLFGTVATSSNKGGCTNDGTLFYYNIQFIPQPSCFNEGTKILILNENSEEKYVPVENLREGTLVKTYLHGYREIAHIGKGVLLNTPDVRDNSMYKMEKTEENGLLEDLILTSGHGILVDSLSEQEQIKIGGTPETIDDKSLLYAWASDHFHVINDTNTYIYYQIACKNDGDNDTRYGIWANGVLVETPSVNQFLAHKYLRM
jgi:hypothetical protein